MAALLAAWLAAASLAWWACSTATASSTWNTIYKHDVINMTYYCKNCAGTRSEKGDSLHVEVYIEHEYAYTHYLFTYFIIINNWC